MQEQSVTVVKPHAQSLHNDLQKLQTRPSQSQQNASLAALAPGSQQAGAWCCLPHTKPGAWHARCSVCLVLPALLAPVPVHARSCPPGLCKHHKAIPATMHSNSEEALVAAPMMRMGRAGGQQLPG